MTKSKMEIVTDEKTVVPVKTNVDYIMNHKTEVSGPHRRQIVDVQAVTDIADSNTLVFNIKNVFEETVPLPPAIPLAILSVLEMVSGKIRARIGNQLLKNELLQEIVQVKHLLDSKKIIEAMILLKVIEAKIQLTLNPCFKTIPMNLTLKGIILIEERLAGLL